MGFFLFAVDILFALKMIYCIQIYEYSFSDNDVFIIFNMYFWIIHYFI